MLEFKRTILGLNFEARQSIERNFWPKVEKTLECWFFHGSLDREGYGLVHIIGNGRTRPNVSVYAHRLAYELMKGKIPEGLELDHLCRHTDCVNPDHLEPVPHRVNMQRGKRAKQTHCKYGHLLAGYNLIIGRKSGSRFCRECNRRRNREHKLRLKVAGNATGGEN